MAKKQEKLNEDLLEAVKNESLTAAKKAIDSGADVDCRSKDGHNPILKAHSPEVTKLLIDSGANVNIRAHKDYDNTALMRSLGYEVMQEGSNYSRITKHLSDAGADVEVKDLAGKNALMVSKSLEATNLLIGAGADVNAKDYKGNSVLMHSLNKSFHFLEEERMEIVEKLVHEGADVNYQRKSDLKTPLMLVQDVSDAQFLLAAEADITAKDAEGKMPHEQEMFNHEKDIQAYLRNAHLNHVVEPVNEVEEEYEYEPVQQRQRL